MRPSTHPTHKVVTSWSKAAHVTSCGGWDGGNFSAEMGGNESWISLNERTLAILSKRLDVMEFENAPRQPRAMGILDATAPVGPVPRGSPNRYLPS